MILPTYGIFSSLFLIWQRCGEFDNNFLLLLLSPAKGISDLTIKTTNAVWVCMNLGFERILIRVHLWNLLKDACHSKYIYVPILFCLVNDFLPLSTDHWLLSFNYLIKFQGCIC